MSDTAYHAAMQALAKVQPTPTDVVEFTSTGRIGFIAPSTAEAEARQAMTQLSAELSPTLLLTDDTNPANQISAIDGHLGEFIITHQQQKTVVDAILDFFSPPLLHSFNPTLRTLPLGYFSVAQLGQTALARVSDMHGVFHKPRYFAYQKSLCAHRGDAGCSRCLSACSTLAITSMGEGITVNPQLCQGCGGCVMTCPSGALRYAYPPPKDTLTALQLAIKAYTQHDETVSPSLLFYTADNAADIRAVTLPEQILPIAVEEVASIGLEIWLCALVYGAKYIYVYVDKPAIAEIAEQQQHIVTAILTGLGYPPLVTLLTNLSRFPSDSPAVALSRASFTPDNDKRRLFFMAFQHLYENAPITVDRIDLPLGSPFGDITVDKAACTLCMACAGVCPAQAIQAGGESPRLSLVEENCLQCNACATICPEAAITLTPRLLTDINARRRPRLLNEEQPLLCLRCQKPFASERLINRIEEKLKTHWMFQRPEDRRRLRLCETCRVHDMFDNKGD